MKITIEVIPHSLQRYPTVGDWQWEGEDLSIKVSDLGDWKFAFLVAFHELIEVMLCKDHGVTEQDVDAFDLNYEAVRKPGDVSEPGNDMLAPYWKEHQLATVFERMMAAALEVSWPEYERRVEEL